MKKPIKPVVSNAERAILIRRNKAHPIPGLCGYYINQGGDVFSVWENGRGRRPNFFGEFKKLKHHRIAGYPAVVLMAPGGKKRHLYVHRLLLETFVGSSEPGYQCRHLDGDRNNFSLSNLQWGTTCENAADKIAHGRLRFGERCKNAKLTAMAVSEMRLLRSKGMFFREIAEMFGVSYTSAYHAITRRNWKHVE